MMTSFAILVGNIRKTFIPAHFNWVKHGRNDHDRMELMMLWRSVILMNTNLLEIEIIFSFR